MSVSDFFFQSSYLCIGIGAICYLKKAIGNKQNRKLEASYQKALLDAREPSGIEAAAHMNFRVMKFFLVLICVGVAFLILGLISERFEGS